MMADLKKTRAPSPMSAPAGIAAAISKSSGPPPIRGPKKSQEAQIAATLATILPPRTGARIIRSATVP